MKKIFIAFMALAPLAGCTTGFLEVRSTTEILADGYYDSEDKITRALMAAYAPMQWPDVSNFGEGVQYCPLMLLSDAMSDDCLIGGANGNDCPNIQLMRNFSATPENANLNLWRCMYSGIYRTNVVIENMGTVEDISEGSRNRILAEAYTLRAYYYHWLWKMWGNVPYSDKIPEDPYIMEQLPADQIYSKIIGDLDFALAGDKIPLTVPVSQVGRFTRAAVRMLKANVVMYQNDQARYAEVLADMRSIISSDLYALFPDFKQMWDTSQEWCCESIFEINYTDMPTNRTWENLQGTGGTVFPLAVSLQVLGDSEFFAGGYALQPVEWALYELYDEEDLRRDGGILNFEKYKETHPSAAYTPRYQDTGLFNFKYICYNSSNSNYVGTDAPDVNFRNNYRVFRYSETLLLAAELIVRTSGPQNEADRYLDMVRARAYGMDIDDAGFAQYKKSATLDNLLLENRLEFALEGHRFWDLVRYGKAVEVLGTRGYAPNKKYQPIPQAEIDQARGTLTQNPY